MEVRKTFFKFQYSLSGGVYGLLSIAFGIAGDILAYILFPGREYDFTKRAVSSLCKGQGGAFFQIGTIISGIFAIPFVLYIINTFDKHYVSENYRKGAFYSALISCVSFICLGIFCGANPIISLIHGVSAVISWISGLIYITFLNISMLKDPKYSKILSRFGFFTSIMLSLLMIIFFLAFLPSLDVLILILPTLEWLNTISLIIWYFIFSTYIIMKKI